MVLRVCQRAEPKGRYVSLSFELTCSGSTRDAEEQSRCPGIGGNRGTLLRYQDHHRIADKRVMSSSDPELWPDETRARGGQAGRSARSRGATALDAMRTLKAKLTIAAVGSLIVGIAAYSVLSLAAAERDLLAQAEARETAQTVNLARDLSQRVVSLQQVLRSTADQIDPALEQLDDALEQHLQAQPALLQQFSNLFVAAPDGRMRLFVDEAGTRRPRTSLADRDYFRNALAEKRPVISDAVPGRVSGEPVIVFVHPIVRDGQVTSLIGGALRLASRNLAASLLERDTAQGSGELLAISNEAGMIIAHPRGDQVLQRLVVEPRFDRAFQEWERQGSPAEPTGMLLRQPGEIVSAAGVAATGWVVWRATPQAALLEPLRRARWQAFLHGSLVIVVLGLLAFAWVARLLRPLRQLEERALRLFDTSRSVHDGWPEVGGEVGALAHALRHVGAERAHLESFSNQVLAQLKSVMDAAPLGIGFTRHQRFELINPAWCQMLQRDEAELRGHPASAIFAEPGDYERLGPQVREAFERTGAYVGEWPFRRKDGTAFWAQLNARPVTLDNPAAGTIWTFTDVTEQRAQREHLEWRATHDLLTGLGNRLAFEQRLKAVLGHPPAALLVIDLDRFKPINDRFGHQAGDAMLKAVASALVTQVRAGDLAVRTGGDEFAVVLERCPAEAAYRVAGEVQRAISRVGLDWEAQTLTVGASVGVAPLSDEHDSVEAWIAAADAACYAAKAAGRGTVRLAHTSGATVIPLPRQDAGT
jgi:diguanylate cyclase (GGDEF)-like protein/PAS domain S-box-containing protein